MAEASPSAPASTAEDRSARPAQVRTIAKLDRASRLALDDPCPLYELDFLLGDEELLEPLRRCCALQKTAAADQLARFEPRPDAEQQVSAEALAPLLGDAVAQSDIRTNDNWSCIVYHVPDFAQSVIDRELIALRHNIDRLIHDRMRELFVGGWRLDTSVSGHFLYPPGGYMGWHTNALVPGWRMYVNHVAEPQRSFFRYRDPASGECVTLWDREWNFRIFRIDAEKPFWHSVYSDTDRFSFGYRIEVGPGLGERVARRASRLLDRLRPSGRRRVE